MEVIKAFADKSVTEPQTFKGRFLVAVQRTTFRPSADSPWYVLVPDDENEREVLFSRN